MCVRLARRQTEVLRRKTLEQSKFWPVYRSRLNNMQTQYKDESNKLTKFNQQVRQRHEHLKRRTKERIFQLRNTVFPIQEIDPQSKSQAFQNE